MSYFSLSENNDDSGDFMPTGPASGGGRSNLNSLFSLNDHMMQAPDANQSLTYKAPKPPSKTSGNQQPSSAPGVAIAVAITAYRLENNQYVSKGKLGAAILRNLSAKDFKILMYVTKQKPVTTCQINGGFNFIVQTNNYACFCDDQKKTWSVLFENNQKLTDFAKQICIGKFYSCSPAPDHVVHQDLSATGDSVNVKSGDSVEVKYTGWLINADGTIGTVFDSNHGTEKTLRFKCGKNKVIKGWEIGMLGMAEGSKRFLVIPPEQAYGQKQVGSRIPPNATLAFEVDLVRVKQAKGASSLTASSSVESLPQANPTEQPPAAQHPTVNPASTPALPSGLNNGVAGETTEHHSPDETVKGRTASLNEQLSQSPGSGGKPDILSRMARMGHTMLPQQYADQAAVHPDSLTVSTPSTQAPKMEQEQQALTPQTVSPLPSVPPQHHPQVPQAYSSGGLLPQHRPSTPTYYPAQMQQLQPSPMMTQHLPHSVPYQQSHQTYTDAHQAVLSSTLPHMSVSEPLQHYPTYAGYRQPQQFPAGHGYGAELYPVLLSESRQQSSEIRLLQEKVDKVSSVMEEVKKNTANNETTQLSASQTMDAGLIMHNIQRIMQENERLKEQLLEKNKQIETQNEKIGDLLQQNQKHVEKSNLILEQRNDSFKESFHQSQTRSLQLEQDKVALTQKLSDATAKVSELTLEVSDAKQRDIDLRQKFKDVYVQEKQRANDAEERVKELEESLSSLKQSDSSRSQTETNLKSEVDDLQQQLTALTKSNAEKVKELEEQVQVLQTAKREVEASLTAALDQHKAQLNELGENSKEETSKAADLLVKVEQLQKELNSVRDQLQEAQESKDAAESRLEIAMQKFGQLRSLFEEQRAKLEEANETGDELEEFKERYGKLRSQAANMKQRYEEKISELEEKLEEQAEASPGGASDPDQLATQVKKVMNSIFQSVRSNISTDEEYGGTEVIQLMLRIIKSTTLDLLSKKEEESEEESEDSDNNDEKGSGSEDHDSPTPKIEAEVLQKSEPNETIAGEADEGNDNDVREGSVDNVIDDAADDDTSMSRDQGGPDQSSVDRGQVEKDQVEVKTPPDQPLRSPSDPPEPATTTEPVDPLRSAPSSDPATLTAGDDEPPEQGNTRAENDLPREDSAGSDQATPPREGAKQSEESESDLPDDAHHAETDNDVSVDSVNPETAAHCDEEHGDSPDISAEQKERSATTGLNQTNPETNEEVAKPSSAEDESATMKQTLTDAIFSQIQNDKDGEEQRSLSRSSSYLNEDRQPPPLFDDDDDDDGDDDNLGWLS